MGKKSKPTESSSKVPVSILRQVVPIRSQKVFYVILNISFRNPETLGLMTSLEISTRTCSKSLIRLFWKWKRTKFLQFNLYYRRKIALKLGQKSHHISIQKLQNRDIEKPWNLARIFSKKEKNSKPISCHKEKSLSTWKKAIRRSSSWWRNLSKFQLPH